MNPDTLKEAIALTSAIESLERNIGYIEKAIKGRNTLNIFYEYDSYNNRNFISISEDERQQILKMLLENSVNRLERIKKRLEEM